MRQEILIGRRHALITFPLNSEALVLWQNRTQYSLSPNARFSVPALSATRLSVSVNQ